MSWASSSGDIDLKLCVENLSHDFVIKNFSTSVQLKVIGSMFIHSATVNGFNYRRRHLLNRVYLAGWSFFSRSIDSKMSRKFQLPANAKGKRRNRSLNRERNQHVFPVFTAKSISFSDAIVKFCLRLNFPIYPAKETIVNHFFQLLLLVLPAFSQNKNKTHTNVERLKNSIFASKAIDIWRIQLHFQYVLFIHLNILTILNGKKCFRKEKNARYDSEFSFHAHVINTFKFMWK